MNSSNWISISSIICSYVRVESVNDKLIAWDDIVAQFPEGQRSRSQIKERWNRVLKVRLLEAEMDPAETWTYRWALVQNTKRNVINLIFHPTGGSCWSTLSSWASLIGERSGGNRWRCIFLAKPTRLW